jgi:L-ascorbate metabolism protein UlaG (beta-lactamase superfamily)
MTKPLVPQIRATTTSTGGRTNGVKAAHNAGAPSERACLEWLGGPTVILQHGGVRILTDPMLGPRGPDAFVLPKHPSTGEENAHIARYTATPHPSLEGLNAVIVSHPHADHVDATAKATLDKGLPVVIPPTGAEGMRAAGFRDVRPLDWGESVVIEAGGTTLRITAVVAHHAHDPTLDRTLGKGNGYILSFEGRSGAYRAYWTGDAVLSDELKLVVPTYGPIDLMLADLGGVGGDGPIGLRSMTGEEAVMLTRLVNPRVVVPIHHTSYSHYREPIQALVQRAEEAGMSSIFRFPVEGAAMVL